MALKGKLRDFSLTQLLNLVHLARKTGALSIDASKGAAELFFHEGKLIYASVAGRSNRLADLLMQADKLTKKQADDLVAMQRTWDDRQIGILLINAGQVSRQDILQALRQNMLDTVNMVFDWQDGTFVFDQKLTSPKGRITIPISLENMVLEGTRRTQQAVAQINELPSLDVVLKFTATRGRNLRNINLSVDEWRVISFINPRNTVATIAKHNQMNEHQIREIVSKLIREDLVEIDESRSPIPISTPPPPPADDVRVVGKGRGKRAKPKFSEPKVEKNIISRLIARIRGL
jgi:hypothetical protein